MRTVRLEKGLNGHKVGKAIDDLEFSLAPREMEVAVLLCCGFHEQAIAHILRIRRHTVHAHVRNIYEKLGVTSRARMVAVLLVSGAVSLPFMRELLNQTGYCETQCMETK